MNVRLSPRMTFLAACAIAGFSATVVAETPGFTFTDLGTLGGTQSAVFGLNDIGQAVGWALVPGSDFPHACLWDNGVATDLGIFPDDEQSVARAINNDGTIIGTSERDVTQGFGTYHAFVYEDGEMNPLPGLGGSWSWASGINAGGVISGYATNELDEEKAVFWDGGELVSLDPYAVHQRQRCHGINDAGVVVGSEYTPLIGADAFMFDGAKWIVIGGNDGQYQIADAFDVNNDNIVVGLCNFPSGDYMAAAWLPSDPTTPINLGTLPGFDAGELRAVNDVPQAVGAAIIYFPEETHHAIFFDGAQLLDLNDFLPADFDGFLWEAMDINNSGQIIATALTSKGWRAYLLTPDDPSSPADVNDDGIVNIDDLFAVINAWGPCGGCPEDINGDDVVNVDDLFEVINNWGA